MKQKDLTFLNYLYITNKVDKKFIYQTRERQRRKKGTKRNIENIAWYAENAFDLLKRQNLKEIKKACKQIKEIDNKLENGVDIEFLRDSFKDK